MDLLFRWIMVLLTTPAAVELSAWTGDVGCFQTISINVWWMGTISLAVMFSAPSSSSAAENMTNLMIWAIVRIGLFHLGVGSFSYKNIWARERLRAMDLLLDSVSEWAARIMSMSQ